MLSYTLLKRGCFFEHFSFRSTSWYHDAKRDFSPLELVLKGTQRSVCAFLSCMEDKIIRKYMASDTQVERCQTLPGEVVKAYNIS